MEEAVTRKEMEQIISLRHEIKAIEASMKSPKSTYVSVFYKDYRSGKGVPKSRQELDEGEEQLRILRGNLTICRRKLIKRLAKAEKFIESIEDSEIRTILRMYYINGNSQQEIADELHYTQSAISTKLRAFWFTEAEKGRG
jgi:DNA-directed RNA polymerase specialized sigma subunit